MSRLLKISQPNCRPCIFLENYLNSLEVKYDSADASEDKSLIEKYDLSSTPVLLLLDDEGNVLDRMDGFHPSQSGRVDELLSKL